MATPFHPHAKRQQPTILLPCLLSLCLLLYSCTTSVYPLAEKESEAVFLPELIGTWEHTYDDDGKDVHFAQVQKAPGNQYRIQVVDRKVLGKGDAPDTTYLLARLISLGDYLFLDCVGDREHPSAVDKDEYMHLGRSTIHQIFRIVLRNQNEVAELWWLQTGEDIRKILRQKKVSFYAQSTETLLLMEPSVQLKKLMLQLVRENPPGVWQTTILIRADPAAGKPA